MTRRRWIADEFSADRAALTGAHAAHLSRTLRARVGQEFEVACGDRVRQATVARVSDERVEFALGDEIAASTDVPITLLLAVFKFDRMEWAIEKCTELNVTTIIPVIARRTEKHLAIAAEKRVERWRRIAREASEQSRRVSPPEISEPVKLRDALALLRDGRTSGNAVIPPEGFSPSGGICGSRAGSLHKESPASQPRRGGIEFSPGREPWVDDQINLSPVGTAEKGSESTYLRIVLAESERELQLPDVLRSRQQIASLILAVGPEGGWTDDELRTFAGSRWIAASLGDTILRAETAAIAALAIARAEL
jgi:16S rRNA (uracil1498-N3)-methyltransferase